MYASAPDFITAAPVTHPASANIMSSRNVRILSAVTSPNRFSRRAAVVPLPATAEEPVYTRLRRAARELYIRATHMDGIQQPRAQTETT